MINVITGLPGSGKTLWLAKTAREYLKAGYSVASNIKFNDPRIICSTKNEPLSVLMELLNSENRILILDELQLFINSRNWEALPLSVQYRLQQHRKFGLHIIGAVQNFKRLDVIARELVQHYYEVRKIYSNVSDDPQKIAKPKPYPKIPFGLFWVSEYFPEDAELKRRRILSNHFFWLRKRDYSMFDTKSVIALDLVNLEKDIEYVPMKVCPSCGSRKFLRAK